MPRRSGLALAKRLRSQPSPKKSGGFWQKRYYDRNVRGYREFMVKLRYVHRNPVKRGLVQISRIFFCKKGETFTHPSRTCTALSSAAPRSTFPAAPKETPRTACSPSPPPATP